MTLAVPGTTPDYWAAADDRTTATMLELLNTRNAKQRNQTRARGRRGH